MKRAFEDPEEAAASIEVLLETKEGDGFLVYPWCLMPKYHYGALRTTGVRREGWSTWPIRGPGGSHIVPVESAW